MYVIQRTEEFTAWLHALRDLKAVARIVNRINNAADGNFGVTATVGGGISEMKIDFGPGYRVYFMRIGEVVFLLLLGGDKSSQRRDIAKAKKMAKIIQGTYK